MAKIRAYKLAEELEIDRHDFVERVREIGIELKGAMASLDDEQIALVREKFGKATRDTKNMEERRVESRGGKTVLRRRRKVVVEEPPGEVAAPESVETPVQSEPVTDVQEVQPED